VLDHMGLHVYKGQYVYVLHELKYVMVLYEFIYNNRPNGSLLHEFNNLLLSIFINFKLKFSVKYMYVKDNDKYYNVLANLTITMYSGKVEDKYYNALD